MVLLCQVNRSFEVRNTVFREDDDAWTLEGASVARPRRTLTRSGPVKVRSGPKSPTRRKVAGLRRDYVFRDERPARPKRRVRSSPLQIAFFFLLSPSELAYHTHSQRMPSSPSHSLTPTLSATAEKKEDAAADASGAGEESLVPTLTDSGAKNDGTEVVEAQPTQGGPPGVDMSAILKGKRLAVVFTAMLLALLLIALE